MEPQRYFENNAQSMTMISDVLRNDFESFGLFKLVQKEPKFYSEVIDIANQLKTYSKESTSDSTIMLLSARVVLTSKDLVIKDLQQMVAGIAKL